MSDDFEIIKNSEEQTGENIENSDVNASQEGKVIDEANYKIRAPKQKGPSAIGRGGDPLFRSIRATREQLLELMEETQTVQDWVQRETCNNVALTCLENENLKEIYFTIKDGFDEYGKISLMGFKTPMGVEIPRLKVYDTNGEVLEVLTGPVAIDEINRRALAYRNRASQQYEELPFGESEVQEEAVIADYSGNPNDYTT